MRWCGSCAMRLVLIGFMAVIVASGGTARADFTFSQPENLGPVINRRNDYGACPSADGLSLFFQSDWPNGGQRDLWVSIRTTPDADWGEPIKLRPAVNTLSHEMDPSISADGLELYFSRGASLTVYDPGGGNLFVATRDTTNDEWEDAVSLGETVNSTSDADGMPSISADGLSLYFQSDRPGGEGGPDLYVTTRPTTNDAWGEPVNLGPIVNSSGSDLSPSITSDGLSLIFSSNRPGKYSSSNYPDLWVTTRRTTSDPWQEPTNLGPVINTDDVDFARISHDGTALFLSCWRRPGGYGIGAYDIWQTQIVPIVDLNGDGLVDDGDLDILDAYMGTDESLCDIGPMPWGDGIVDEADLAVLMSYWGQDILPPEVAYWKLDEIEGDTAYDSAGEYDGTLHGDPLWQPGGGIIDGALQLDGIDDYIRTPSLVQNTNNSELSVFAWVKGGAPWQVAISQIGRSRDWLCADPVNGCLMTELRHHVNNDPPLLSQAVIADGEWHRVGVVWDIIYGNRILYVDDIEVASDGQESVGILYGGLNIGTGKSRVAGSYWSGLIDDVRIYDRAVAP